MSSFITMTGHRNIAKDETDRIINAFKQIIYRLGADCTFCAQLADGADQILCRVVLNHKRNVLAVIPMGTAGFGSMDLQDKRTFNEIINHSHTQIIEIACSKNENCLDKETRDKYYKAANEMMISKSDAVIAVWDGKAPSGDAGTGAVVNATIADRQTVY